METSELIADDEQEQDDTDVIVILPKLVRNFAEGKETPEKSEFFLLVLSGWYCGLLHSIYRKNENMVNFAANSSKARNNILREFGSLEENLNLFIARMLEKYQRV